MKRATRLLVAAAVLAASPAFADARSEAKAQVEFGINVAQRGLWREAIYRWEKAVEIDPTYAAAFNDLAIAYEHEGQLDKARKAYEKAIEIEPNNAQIRQNYELFKEINDRAAQQRQVTASRSVRLQRPCAAAGRGLRRRTVRNPDRNADPAQARRLGVPARARRRLRRRRQRGRSTRTRKRCACCAASCARSRRCA